MSDPIENTVYEFPAQNYQHIVTHAPLYSPIVRGNLWVGSANVRQAL